MMNENLESIPDPFDNSQAVADQIDRDVATRDRARKRLTLSNEKLFDLTYQYKMILDYLVADQNVKLGGIAERISPSEISQAALRILEIHANQD